MTGQCDPPALQRCARPGPIAPGARGDGDALAIWRPPQTGRTATPGSFSSRCKDQGDGRVEMRARDRSKDRDDDDEDRARRDRISKQRDRLISAGEPLRHDAGPDHGCHQNSGSQSFRDEPSGQRASGFLHATGSTIAPMLFLSACLTAGALMTFVVQGAIRRRHGAMPYTAPAA